MTTLEGRGKKGHQGLKEDQLDYLELMRDRQVRAYELRKSIISSKPGMKQIMNILLNL